MSHPGPARAPPVCAGRPARRAAHKPAGTSGNLAVPVTVRSALDFRNTTGVTPSGPPGSPSRGGTGFPQTVRHHATRFGTPRLMGNDEALAVGRTSEPDRSLADHRRGDTWVEVAWPAGAPCSLPKWRMADHTSAATRPSTHSRPTSASMADARPWYRRGVGASQPAAARGASSGPLALGPGSPR